MESLVESVPNFSEGSRVDTLDDIAAAIGAVTGSWLLDVSADADHGRSVYTLAGFPGRVMTALEAAITVAIERIDLRHQHGQHPRIGAIDVIPFIPLGDTTMEQCIDGARRFAAAVADRFELPVYLYGQAAAGPRCRTLAELRRPGFEGLDEAMRQPGGAPDFGPPRPHPTAGATAIGARRPLIAYNVQISSTDVTIARRIATRIRERDGGLPAVQALGLYLESQGCAQVSMNVLDHERTPLWRIWESVDHEARKEGVSVLDSELIGLAPVGAFLQVAEHIGLATGRPHEELVTEAAAWLRIRHFEPGMALELRLAALRESS